MAKEMKPTISNLIFYCKKNDLSLYAKLLRPFSIHLTWLLVRTPISANQVTVLQGIFGIIGAVLLGYGKFVLGAVFLQIGYILDLCDGEVARWKHQQSNAGNYLDLIGHRTATPAMFFGLGIGTGYIVAGMIAGLLSVKFIRSK
jgi:phosphatidylglycerophosphate synthase